MKLSIVIKALNEERNIERCLNSALVAARAVPGGAEVILADSLSTDETIEIAKRYSVRIVQLVDPADRSCGIGAELGYRAALGEYIYVLDADMEIHGDFLCKAIEIMDADFDLGGVGGLVEEMHVTNAEFRGRVSQGTPHMQAGEVDRLNMGGLYRRGVIERLGYLTNRNLHSFEEYELGVRVRQAGYRLLRLDMPAVRHYGHTDTSFKLLWRRWKSGYAWGLGELLRASVGRPYLGNVLTEVKVFRSALFAMVWWSSVLVTLVATIMRPQWWPGLLLILGAPLLLLVIKRRSLIDAVYVLCFQSIYALGLLRGFVRGPRGLPESPFPVRKVQ